MIRRLIAPALLLAVAPVAAQAKPADDIAVLEALNAKWLGSYVTRDGKALGEVLADDFAAINPTTGAVRTKAEMIAGLAAETGTPPQVTWRDLKVTVHGNTAILTAVSQIALPDGRRFENRYLDVYARRKGRWQAVAAQVTRLNPGN